MRITGKRRSTSFRLLGFALLIVFPVFLTACEESDTEFLIELALDYAEQHRLIDAEGNPNYGTLASHTFFGTTGDPEADAALEAGYVVKNLNDADNLAQQGAEEGDPAKIQAAIDARPGDWSYREQQGALLIAQGDIEGAEAAFKASQGLVNERAKQGEDCWGLRLNQLQHREQAILTQLDRTDPNSPEHQQLLEYLEETRIDIAFIEDPGSWELFCEGDPFPE